MSEIFQLCNMGSEKEFLEYPYRYKSQTANIKFDGERIMAKIENGEVLLVNRNKRACNPNFKEVVDELKKLEGNFILDGEVISEDDDFTKLQRRALTKDKKKQEELIKEIPVKFIVFDILKYDDVVIRGKELKYRIEKIKEFEELIKEKGIKFVEVAEFSNPKEMYKKAKEEKREGIVTKYLDYGYYEGRHNWTKIKFFKEGELEVIKYSVNPKGIRVENKEGHSCQISNTTKAEKVKKLIDEEGKALILIQYLSISPKGRYRFPSFRGIKDDEDED